MKNENRTKPTSDSQEDKPIEDIQHQDKVPSKEKVNGWLLSTPCDVMNASAETCGVQLV